MKISPIQKRKRGVNDEKHIKIPTTKIVKNNIVSTKKTKKNDRK